MVVMFYSTSVLIFLSSASWFSMWFSLELMSMSFISIMYKEMEQPKILETCLGYFLVQSFSSMCLIISVYSLSDMTQPFLQKMNLLAMAAIFTKLALIPMHMWFPSVSENTEKSSFILLLTVQKILPLCIMASTTNDMPSIILFFIVLTSLGSPALNLPQTNTKLILVYSSISHTAWIMTGLLSSMKIWVLYFLIYSATTSLLVKNFNKHFQNSENKNKNARYTNLSLLMSLAGLPPLVGFYMKASIIFSVIETQLALSLVLLLMSVIDFYIYIRLVTNSLFQENSKSWMTKNAFKDMKLIFLILFSLSLSNAL